MNRALAAGAGRVSAAVNVSKQEPIERRGNESFMFASPEKPAPGLDAAEASLGSNRSRANGFGLAGSAFFREFRHGTDMTRPSREIRLASVTRSSIQVGAAICALVSTQPSSATALTHEAAMAAFAKSWRRE